MRNDPERRLLATDAAWRSKLFACHGALTAARVSPTANTGIVALAESFDYNALDCVRVVKGLSEDSWLGVSPHVVPPDISLSLKHLKCKSVVDRHVAITEYTQYWIR